MTEAKKATITVGAKAPAFTLNDADGEPVRLADLRGRWVVLYFYPRADTPGCTTEACEFTERLRDFDSMDATVLAASPDLPPALAKFRAKHRLGVTLLSDPDREALAKYGAWGTKKLYGKETVGVIRSTVIIDPSGKVAHHWKSVRAAGHAEHVKARLADLRSAASD